VLADAAMHVALGEARPGRMLDADHGLDQRRAGEGPAGVAGVLVARAGDPVLAPAVAPVDGGGRRAGVGRSRRSAGAVGGGADIEGRRRDRPLGRGLHALVEAETAEGRGREHLTHGVGRHETALEAPDGEQRIGADAQRAEVVGRHGGGGHEPVQRRAEGILRQQDMVGNIDPGLPAQLFGFDKPADVTVTHGKWHAIPLVRRPSNMGGRRKF